MLHASQDRLVEAYDLVMFDLDGVVWVGDAPVPGAPEHLAKLRDSGTHVAFITNNASRPPAAVVERLAGVGVAADVADIVTSAQAAAHVLLERCGADAPVAYLGAVGLREALEEVGLRPVGVDDDDAVALVTGYGPEVRWQEVMRAAMRIRDGLPWVASNTDLTLPTPTGPAPGHGTLVGLLARFSGVDPVVAGKPAPPLLEETIRRIGGRRPLMVGDRLDTDIEGAHRTGVDSLLVLSGVSGLSDLSVATPAQRPSYLSLDLAGLLERHRAPARTDSGWTLGGWTASSHGGVLRVTGHGAPDDWWRAVASASWEHLDETGTPVDIGDLLPPTERPGG